MPSQPRRKPPARLAVVTDSSACLPAQLLQAHEIITVPLAFQFDGQQYLDGQLPADEFYRRLAESRKHPSTAAPAPGEFAAVFRRVHEAGATTILCLTLSAEYSGTHAAALRAADIARVEIAGTDVIVLDTGGLAMTHGFAVLEAARAAQAGADPAQAAEIARSVTARAEMIGVLGTMRYLGKSGRVPWVVQWAASLLHIRPVIAFTGGAPRSVGRVRTTTKGMDEMIHHLLRKAGPPERMHAAVMHANAPDWAAALARRVDDALGPAELIVTEFTAVMGVHTGPGFLGLAFYSDEGIPQPAARPEPRRSLLDRDVRVMEETLGPPPQAQDKLAMVMLSGLPGAGKSHLARELAKRRPFVQLDSDRLRKALFKRPSYSQVENIRLFNAYHELLGRLLAGGISVICDATNLKEAYRQPQFEIARRHGARLVVVHVEAPPAVIRDRLDHRLAGEGPWDESEAGHDIYDRMSAEAEPIQREHIVVDTSKDLSAAIGQILREAGS